MPSYADQGGWISEFGCIRHDTFGTEEPEDNVDIKSDPVFDNVLEVFYPQGSWSPNATRMANISIGGAQFKGLGGSFCRCCLSSHVLFCVRCDQVNTLAPLADR